jgi:hypothetical protein
MPPTARSFPKPVAKITEDIEELLALDDYPDSTCAPPT